MSGYQTDVFIAGGGPAGLAAAIAARQKGFRVMVADGCRPPIDKACGEGLLADALASLQQLGVALSDEHGAFFSGIRFIENGVRAEARFVAGPGLGIRRTVLHALLAERAAAAGVDLLWGCPVDLSSGQIRVGSIPVQARWMIGADGQNSRFRRWAGLDQRRGYSRRFGFRRHFRVRPWTDCVEVYWSEGGQAYVTPVGASEICLALIRRQPDKRFEDWPRLFPELGRRLAGAEPVSTWRGAVTASCRLRSVAAGSCALIGEASGSLDAITGEGLVLAFRQAIALAGALERNQLGEYAAEHRRIARLPRIMERLILSLDRHPWLRHPIFRAFAAEPRLFAGLLAVHAGHPSPALSLGDTACL